MSMATNTYCDNCGSLLESDAKFCTKCGHKVVAQTTQHKSPVEEKWWERLFKVIYILAYLPLIILLILVWSDSATDYDIYTRTWIDTPGIAIWYCFLTAIIYLVIMRLVKLAFLYVAKAEKPKWKAEFKKLF